MYAASCACTAITSAISDVVGIVKPRLALPVDRYQERAFVLLATGFGTLYECQTNKQRYHGHCRFSEAVGSSTTVPLLRL